MLLRTLHSHTARTLCGTALLLTAGACSMLYASDTPPETDVGFQPLEIYQFEDGTRSLTVKDLNADGLDDILFANNHVSRLEILIRKPDSEEKEHLPELESSFEDRGFIVDQSLKSVRTEDLNGDGRLDIITFGTAIGLQIRYQEEDGSFNEPLPIFISDHSSVTTIQIGDLNGDDAPDILVCRRNEADLLWNAEKNPFREKKTLTFSAEKSFYGSIDDINGDGHDDLTFYFSSARNALKVRYGDGKGFFGIEHPIDLPPWRHIRMLHDDVLPLRLGVILGNRIAFRGYHFVEEEQPAILESQEISPTRIGLTGSGTKIPPAWTSADFNQDGYEDMIISAPELSRLHLYWGGSEGLNPEPLRIDTLSEVTRLSRLESGTILVVSAKEKIAALHPADALERFPTILQTPGHVLAGCAIESGKACWFVCQDEERNMQLVAMGSDGQQTASHALDIRNEPSDMMAFRLPDNQTGILLFMPYDTPKMYLVSEEEATAVTAETFRALAQPFTRSHVRLESPGDGSILTVTQGALARRFEWTGSRYDTTRQFNPENPQGELMASCAYSFLDGSAGSFFYDLNTSDLLVFDAEHASQGRIHIPDAAPTVYAVTQLTNPDRDTLLLLDQGGINQILSDGMRLVPVSIGEYLSPSEDPMLAYQRPVRLGSPPRPMIALIDPANRTIEIISETEEAFERELMFEVYLSSLFVQRNRKQGTEPHGVESGDLNGDGIGDLVLLSQDKLLIYLGE